MINWEKPYGTVCGIPGTKYEQNGEHFDVKGESLNKAKEDQKKTQEKIDKAFVDAKEVAVKPVTPTKKECQRLKESGLTNTQIGREFGVSRQKITKILCK